MKLILTLVFIIHCSNAIVDLPGKFLVILFMNLMNHERMEKDTLR